MKGITIRHIIYEDHSAKTFNRPAWKKYLVELRRHKERTDYVLFLKWDRFTRNAGDAYQMINVLRKLGVVPQAIEQPLDLSIPENKMMLAFYLAVPEVENDRWALNVIHGMRRARKESRYNEHLPLSGFLICPECGKLLTGSTSKGHTKYYTYYHCTTGCTCQFNATTVNERFLYKLKKMISRPEVEDVCKITLTESWHQHVGVRDDREQIIEEKREIEKRFSKARELLVSGELDGIDFREIKSEYNTRLEKLQAKLSACNNDQLDFSGLLDAGLKTLFHLDNVYETGPIEKKREVISSMYPEKLTFNGDDFRTTRVNEAARLIYSLGEGLGGNEKGQNGLFSTLSSQVGTTGFDFDQYYTEYQYFEKFPSEFTHLIAHWRTDNVKSLYQN